MSFEKLISEKAISEADETVRTDPEFVQKISNMQQKWHVKINLKIGKSFHKAFIALIDSGADLNCIQEGLIPTQYYEKTLQKLYTANNQGYPSFNIFYHSLITT